jgi:SAM-dependent methyltransferase
VIPTGHDRSEDEIAREYDQIPEAIVMPPYFYPEVVRFVGDIMGQRVLDGGCGNGALLALLRAGRPAELFGLELSSTLCSLAREKVGESARIRQGSLQARWPFSDATFDLVVMTEVAEHLANPSVAFREARRVLARDGRLVVTFPNATAYEPFFRQAEQRGGVGRWWAFLPWEHPKKTRQPIDTVYTFREVRALLAANGFVVSRMRGRETFPYLWDWMYIEPRPHLRAALKRTEAMRPLADWLANRVRAYPVCYRLFIECVLPSNRVRSNTSPFQEEDQ